VRPDVLLVPLLGFDAEGWRLGYGGGYYDRSLQALRASGAALAVGFGYAAQEVERLPREPFDERLDWIVTELGARPFRC
jgi:5-formyltetrahydrofolate cyclo-ligase